MSDEIGAFLAGCAMGVLIALLPVGIVANCSEKQVWKKETIDRGYAHYNKTNGNWEWNDEEIKDAVGQD